MVLAHWQEMGYGGEGEGVEGSEKILPSMACLRIRGKNLVACSLFNLLIQGLHCF
jgi:hypothetical protein